MGKGELLAVAAPPVEAEDGVRADAKKRAVIEGELGARPGAGLERGVAGDGVADARRALADGDLLDDLADLGGGGGRGGGGSHCESAEGDPGDDGGMYGLHGALVVLDYMRI